VIIRSEIARPAKINKDKVVRGASYQGVSLQKNTRTRIGGKKCCAYRTLFHQHQGRGVTTKHMCSHPKILGQKKNFEHYS